MYDFDDYYNLLGRYSADQKQDCGLLMGASRMAHHHIALSRTWLMNVNLVSRGASIVAHVLPPCIIILLWNTGCVCVYKIEPTGDLIVDAMAMLVTPCHKAIYFSSRVHNAVYNLNITYKVVQKRDQHFLSFQFCQLLVT